MGWSECWLPSGIWLGQGSKELPVIRARQRVAFCSSTRTKTLEVGLRGRSAERLAISLPRRTVRGRGRAPSARGFSRYLWLLAMPSKNPSCAKSASSSACRARSHADPSSSPARPGDPHALLQALGPYSDTKPTAMWCVAKLQRGICLSLMAARKASQPADSACRRCLSM